MPNHFHLLLRQIDEEGVSPFIGRLANSYTKYFNTKYEKSGHVFQGPFQATHIDSNEQLLYTSAYVHRNPREIKGWKDKEDLYPWSSYQDYIREDRWGEFLKPNIVLDQLKSAREYKRIVDESGAKEFQNEIV